jgi:hypothetical protein
MTGWEGWLAPALLSFFFLELRLRRERGQATLPNLLFFPRILESTDLRI